MKSRNTKLPYNKRGNMIPVMLNANGATGLVDTSTIPPNQWEVHHGKTASGVQVNSLKSIDINESILFERTDGFQFSVTKDDFEVAAVKRLTRLGYNIQAPAA